MNIRILAACFLFASTAAVAAAEPLVPDGTDGPVLIITRHAEKLAGDDPCLNKAGTARARKLATLLDGLKISALLSTDYCRTRETLQPVADAKKLPITLYPPEDADRIRQALDQAGHSVVLVAGHSNTLPTLLEQLGVHIDTIDESRYGDLYVVVFSPSGPRLKRIEY